MSVKFYAQSIDFDTELLKECSEDAAGNKKERGIIMEIRTT
jgi:hypothetical protein